MPAGAEIFNYQEHVNFWNSDHPLAAEAKKLSQKVPMSGESDEPVIEVFRLAQNLYYDLYNNGGGNQCRFDIYDEFKAAVNNAFGNAAMFDAPVPCEDGSIHIMSTFHDVWMSMSHKSWFPKNEANTLLLAEKFMTEVVYYASESSRRRG